MAGIKKWYQSEKPFLKDGFKNRLQKCQEYLQKIFTTPENRTSAPWMSEEEFHELKIPVVPTSSLNKKCVSKMAAVGHENWFDMLLVECCKREQGMALVNIHSDRLAKLPDHVVNELDPNKDLAPEFLKVTRENPFIKAVGGELYYVVGVALYRHYKYSLYDAPRFEQY